jgi:ribokinase
MTVDVVVIGHIGRDLVVQVDAIPEAGAGTPVAGRLEMLGGKGANQAVGLAQLGRHPALIGAVGDDPVGAWLFRAATADGIDTTGVAVRAGQASSLIVSVVDGSAGWRYLEELIPASYLTPGTCAPASPGSPPQKPSLCSCNNHGRPTSKRPASPKPTKPRS